MHTLLAHPGHSTDPGGWSLAHLLSEPVHAAPILAVALVVFLIACRLPRRRSDLR